MTELVPQDAGLPMAGPTAASQPFWEGCSRQELLFQRCDSCGRANFTPTAACRACLGTHLRWERSSGRGSLYSWTVVWRPQTEMFRVPYAPAIVDVAEGYQMLSNVVNCRAEQLHVGMPLEVVFTRLPSHVTMPYFQPTGRQ